MALEPHLRGLVAPTSIDAPPPRLPWEEPRPEGWSSGITGAGVEVALFLSAIAAALIGGRAGRAANRLMHQHDTASSALSIALWILCCVLVLHVLMYIWQRHGKLAVLTAMLTDYGRLARLGGRPPIWLDQPPEPEGSLRIAHLSDLHIAEGATVRLVERARPAGNSVLGPLLDAANSTAADLVLISGDITDRGTAASWTQFLDTLHARGLAERTLLVPGNHDLALVEPIEGRVREALRTDRFGIVQLANLLKFAEAFAATAGGRLGRVLLDGHVTPYGAAFANVERVVRPLLEKLPAEPVPPLTWRHYLAERGPYRAYAAKIGSARERLLSLFPIAVPIEDRDAVIFVLNSCARVYRHAASNAIGCIGRAQYRRLHRLAESFRQTTRIITLHHHVVRRGEELSVDLKFRVLAKFTVLDDAMPLVRFCKKYGVRTIFNGHRHVAYQLRLGNGTVLLASPSSTFGDDLAQDPRPQFWLYEIASRPVPPSVGIFRTAIRLSV